MGESYILGNGHEENEFKPYRVHPAMFEENRAVMIALGAQHVVVLAIDESMNTCRSTD